MAHKVKCYYCEEHFDRDYIPYYKVTPNRYAHLDCWTKQKSAKENVKGVFATSSEDDIYSGGTRGLKADAIVGSTISERVPYKKGDNKDMAAEVKSNINSAAEQMLTQMQEACMNVFAKVNKDDIVKKYLDEIDAKVSETYGFIPRVYEVKTEYSTRKITGAVHEEFDKVLKIVAAGEGVYLTGPAGTGKNVICKQVAEALGLEFYFSNAVTQEYKITGFIDANGVYQETQFYKAFTNGGVFFLDEMDASIAEALITLNAALSNGYFDFPIGKVEAHPDFRVIAAGNTVGNGADESYVGRYALDGATLDRFAIVNIDYSPTIEAAVTENNNELCEFARDFRASATKAGIKCLFTYRALTRISKFEKIFSNLEEVLNMSLLKGMEPDDLTILANGLKKKENKYAKALISLTF